MSEQMIVSLILMVIMVAQQIAWMVYSQKLVNKAMSGTFREYQHAVQAPPPKPPHENNLIKLNLDEGPSQADELNQLMGL